MSIEQLFERISVNSYYNVKQELNRFKDYLGINDTDTGVAKSINTQIA